jgi:glycosyltransferase involved in cell wall biosynthesis
MSIRSALASRLSVVVPAYNEEKTLAAVTERLLLVPHLHEIVIVDDCSTDHTPAITRRLAEQYGEVRVIRHNRNQGKTAALKTGFAATTGDIVIVQDADLEYDPAEIKDVIQPILTGVADVVYGSRFLVHNSARALSPRHFFANKSLTFFSNLLTRLRFSDVETGYKAFRGDIIRHMVITSKGFGFEIEATAKICKLGCVAREVPITYYGRTYEQGKKIRKRDGLLALWYIVRYNLLTSVQASFHVPPATLATDLQRLHASAKSHAH